MLALPAVLAAGEIALHPERHLEDSASQGNQLKSALLPRHRHLETLFRRDQVIVTVLLQIDLHPVKAQIGLVIDVDDGVFREATHAAEQDLC